MCEEVMKKSGQLHAKNVVDMGLRGRSRSVSGAKM